MEQTTKNNIFNALSFIINLLCMSFVIYKSEQCIAKFISKPESAKVSIEDPVKYPYPAISICPQSITKYAITEELGNYLRPDMDLPELFATLRKDLLICATGMDKFFKKWERNTYNETCNSGKPKLGCKVREMLENK